MSKVLLYSGGTDSWLIDKLWKPDIKLYINIQGRYSEEEMKLLPKDVEILDMPFLGKTEIGKSAYVPLRNLYFLMFATNYGNEICLGAVASDAGNSDKTEDFLINAGNIINQCIGKGTNKSKGDYHICTDFVKKSKFELLGEYLDNGGNLDKFVYETFSCHNPVNGKECWDCKCCYKKFLQCVHFGYDFGEEIEKKMINFFIRYFKEVQTSTEFNDSKYFIFDRPKEGLLMKLAVKKVFEKHGYVLEDYLCNT